MNRKKLIKIITVIFFSLIFVVSWRSSINAADYSCLEGSRCQSPGTIVRGDFYYSIGADPNFPELQTCQKDLDHSYGCSGTDKKCSGEVTYYLTLADCVFKDNAQYQGCCGDTKPPEQCVITKDDGTVCGNQACDSTNPRCKCITQGCKIDGKPDGDSCATKICKDPEPVCVDCNLDDCTTPLINKGLDDYELANYRSCPKFGSCAGTKYGSCYEVPSAQPTSSLVVLPDSAAITSLGCTSSTHTGSEINNPIRMRSRHIDPDSSDIEALYIWLKTETAIPGTPQYIDINSNSGQTGKTYTRNSYGFMMHKEGSNWVPYIPSLVGGSNDKWIKASYSASRFPILGPNSQTLAFVEIHSVSGPGNSITMEFSLDYRGIISNDALRVIDGTYNIFVMANDVFGFTPYDNYGPAVTKMGDYFDEEQIRFNRNWTDSGKDWSFDFTNPGVSDLTSVVSGPTNIRFEWDANDARGLYAVVGNIYASDGVENAENITDAVLTSAGVKTAINPYLPLQQGDSTVGDLRSGYIARAINMGGIAQEGSLNVNVGANREGSLIYHATVFDNACNTDQSYSLFDLEDWIVTYGGLVYSSGGIEFQVKDLLDPNIWNLVALLTKIKPAYADISSELYGDASSTPSLLDKSSVTKSFSISPFKGFKGVDYYNDVRNTFERREIGIPNITRVPNTTGTLTGNLGGGTIKVVDRIGNLTVGSPSNAFTCDGKGVIFVSGNLTIENEILNSNYNHDACIFVVKGNVIINQGSNSSGGSIGYDEINAYILTNGTVTITGDSSLDGLYISGGIQSLGGINTIGRYLGLSYRDTHPVLVINHHSKYGIFSSELIGNPVDMVKIEVGFKPY